MLLVEAQVLDSERAPGRREGPTPITQEVVVLMSKKQLSALNLYSYN